MLTLGPGGMCHC